MNKIQAELASKDQTEADEATAIAERADAKVTVSALQPPQADADRNRLDSADKALQQLDPRSIGLSRLINAMIMSAVCIVAVIAGVALFWVVPFPAHLLIVVVWFVLAGLGVLNVGWWPQWHYLHWSYRVTDKVFELRHGVLWRVSVQIPLTRLQHVDLHRGPLESRWGLASLEIHTAGTRDASHRISGLDLAVAGKLRDQLVDAANRRPNGSAQK